MKFIDLHLHSTASDGTLTPAEIVRAAERKGLAAIALTDHDTVAGVDEALQKAEDAALEMIPGIEISCDYQGKELHILGLYVNHRSEELLSFLASRKQLRRKRNLEILAALNRDGFSITLDDLMAGNPDTVITRAHFGRCLLEKEYVASIPEAFKKYLSPGCPYYRKKVEVTPEECMGALRAASAFAAIAHPCQYKLGWSGTEELIVYLKGLGLRGVECYHSSNNQDESGKLRKLAERHGLLVTGGSDFHGDVKPDIGIGSGRGNLRVPALLLDDIKIAMFFG